VADRSGEADRVMTALQAQRERLERMRASVAEIIRTSRAIVEESKALPARLEQQRSRDKSN
jgi:hypothetical protein